MSREREIYARNVTGIRRPAIFGRLPAKLPRIYVNYAKVWAISSACTSQRGSDISRDYAGTKAGGRECKVRPSCNATFATVATRDDNLLR